MSYVNPKPPVAARPNGRPTKPKSPVTPALALFLVAAVIGIFLWAKHPPTASESAAASVPAPKPPTELVSSPPPAPAPPMPEDPAAAPAADSAAASTPTERVATAVNLLTSPTATAQQARELIDSTFAPLYLQLGLSPADAEAFGDLLTQRLAADRQGLADAASQGYTLANNPVEVAQAVRAAIVPVERQIVALLGRDGYQQYQTFAAPRRAAVAAALLQNSR